LKIQVLCQNGNVYILSFNSQEPTKKLKTDYVLSSKKSLDTSSEHSIFQFLCFGSQRKVYLAQILPVIGVNIYSFNLQKYIGMETQTQVPQLNTQVLDRNIEIDFITLNLSKEKEGSSLDKKESSDEEAPDSV
jgi:hypothetical protein